MSRAEANNFPAHLIAMGVAAAICAASSCAPAGPPPVEIDAEAAAAQALVRFDTNADGQLDSTELASTPGLRACLPSIDTDDSGTVSGPEIEGRLQQYLELGPHLEPFVCYVYHRGQPLAGGTVRLVPEPFLSAALSPATGEIGDNGFCVVQISADELPIVHSGMYRVEIRAAAAPIAAKYNDQSELGVEIASATITQRRGGTVEFHVGN